MRLFALLFFSTWLVYAQAQTESACPQAPVLTKSTRANIFTEQQEIDLGDVAAESVTRDVHIIEDEELVAPLRRIGERVVRYMPESHLKHQFFLVDESEANAYALPGGRVYVTRKLIATTRNEDELAGVLAHEVGHQLNHDTAVLFTKLLKVFLNVTSLGNRDDVENRYHELLESYRKKSVDIDTDEDKSQINADQVSVFAVARAGYDPQAVVTFWDRFTERKGRKGSWFSDVFGSTAPESKRLREFATNASQVPAGCKEKREASADFDTWRAALLRFNGFGKKLALPNMLSKKVLDPPLQGELTHFRFSPDGKLILAQDDTSIFVLQREPLKVLFRIDAPGAFPAHFTTDSKTVVFHNEALRVYKWSVAEQRETDVHDVYVFRGCLRSAISPDGNILACFRPDPDQFIPVGIRLINVDKGQDVFEKKNFIDGSVGDGRAWSIYKYLIFEGGPAVTLEFSSDGRYFLAGVGPFQFGYDFKDERELNLPGKLKTIMETSFGFLGPDRVLGVDGKDGYDSKIVTINGEVIQSGLHIGPLAIETPTFGDFVMIRPLPESPVGIMDLKENKIFLASKTNAVDVYDGTWVNERANGEVALYRRPLTAPLATVTLPRAPLGYTRAVMFSPDLKVLALSEKTRGKIWDLTGSGALNLAPFNGAFFESSTALLNFAPPNRYRKLLMRGTSEKDLRKQEGDQQGNTVASINLDRPAIVQVASHKKRERVFQVAGTYVVILPKDPDEHPTRDVTFEIHDVRSGKLLWTRFFKRMPNLGWNPGENVLVLAWDLTDKGAKEEIKQDPEAARLAETILQKDESYFVVALDVRTGTPMARFPIDTGRGSFKISDMIPTGKYLMFQDSHHRVLIYDLKGQRIGRYFGRAPVICTKTDILAIEREPGRVVLFDLAAKSKKAELTFESPIEYAQFSDDGERLAVLTERQEVYTLKVSSAQSGVSGN
ncbi:MAG TPA: M48 family metalloprotease [Terriglobales bacterium]|nr:M48 family metalloprotease [Terriglobales bacterium]